MGQQIYEKDQAAAAAEGAGDDTGSTSEDEEVVDAEFSEVDDENKG